MEFRRYWEILWRRKLLLIPFAVVIPLFTYLLLQSISPIYKSEGKLWIQMNALAPKYITTLPSQLGQLSFTNNDNALGTIEELLNSEAVVGRVIREMALRDKETRMLSTDDFINPGRLRLARQKQGVYIKKITDSDVFQVIGYSQDPVKAKEIADRVMQAFLDAFTDLYRSEAARAQKSLKASLSDVGARLRSAETALFNYRLSHNLASTDDQKKAIISEISTLESSNIATLEASLARVLAAKTREHPDATAILEQIKKINQQIGELQKLLAIITKSTQKEDELSREVVNLRTVYNTLVANIEATKSALALEMAQAFSIQRPMLYAEKGQNQYFPPRKKLVPLVAAFFVGMFLALFFAFLTDYVDDSIWEKDHIKDLINKKIFIPVPFGDTSRSQQKARGSRIKESLSNLTAQIQQSPLGRGKIFSVVSPSIGDGKTVVAAFLAGAFADQGKKTILVDGNMRNPAQHTLWNISGKNGLFDYLRDNILPEHIAAHPVTNSLFIMTAGPDRMLYPQNALSSAKLELLFRTLATHYDAIVVDTPASESGPDALILSHHADGAVFVVSQGGTSRGKAADYMELLDTSSIPVIAVVMNKYASTHDFLWKFIRALFRRSKKISLPEN
jgi:tyrosine-protein kinase Etk/Wzc